MTRIERKFFKPDGDFVIRLFLFSIQKIYAAGFVPV